MGDEALPRVGAAREEDERRADVRGPVVERAAQRQLLVVQRGTCRPRPSSRARGRRRRRPSRPGGRAAARRASRRRCRSPRSRRRRPRRRPASAPKSGASARRSGRPPTATGRPPASATHAQSISPIGPGPEHGDRLPGLDPGALDPAQAARERLDHRRHLGREPARDGVEVHARDRAPGTTTVLGVGAVQQRPRAARPSPRRGVRGDDAPAGRDVEAAELVAERAREPVEQDAGGRGGTSSGRCRR